MTLTDSLLLSDCVRLKHWPTNRYWVFNRKEKCFDIPGTEIKRTVLTIDQVFATDWEPHHP